MKVLLCLLSLQWTHGVLGYTSPHPSVNHRSLAGVWKLTTASGEEVKVQARRPLKEFTVYPKDRGSAAQQSSPVGVKESSSEMETEVLLMLQEDGSFQQMKDEKEDQIPDKLQYHKGSDDGLLKSWWGPMKGHWDFVDGKLILAADPPKNAASKSDEDSKDTLFVGKVVATTNTSLADNPVLSSEATHQSSSRGAALDTHLSVPDGKVKVGKFFYPKTHPSFFELPMFQPKPKGKFRLQQILGSLNTALDEQEEVVEKFQPSNFFNKTFLLTAHPLKERRPKGELRWSIKYNKFVRDPSPKQKQEEERPAMIRVWKVAFFANQTFATQGGIGQAILRGKFDVIGKEKDYLWMQVWRFGFGRSVSGSTYSEGKCLSKDDEKCYWGKISFESEESLQDNADSEIVSSEKPPMTEKRKGGENDDEIERLFVRGSVLLGYGLEPLPVGRFIMREVEQEEEEDDGVLDEEDDEEAMLERLFQQQEEDESNDDDLDWSTSFQ